MYVGVVHTITNKSAWDEKLVEFQESPPPEGYSILVTYIGSSTDYACCLWDVPSVEALQPLLDGLTAGAATNMYFPVDPAAFGTTGIPSQSIDLDQGARSEIGVGT